MDIKETKQALDSSPSVKNNSPEEKTQNVSIKPKKKPLIIGLLAGLIVAGVICGLFIYKNVIKPANIYKEADTLFAEKNYDEAKAKYKALGDYKDSVEKAIECDYAAATDAFANGDYDSAKQTFDSLSGYKDSDIMSSECVFQKAMLLYDSGDYESAKPIFDSLIGYKNSDDMSKGCDYQKAIALYESGDYQNAITIFCSMFDYSNTKQYVYSMFLKLVGQSYVDKYSEGLGYLGNYIQSQSASFSSWVRAYTLGVSKETSWYPSQNDANLTKMLQCKDALKSMKSTYTEIFSESVLEACNDETLSTANEKFDKLHSSALNMFTSAKATSYVNDAIGGSSSKITTDSYAAANAAREYRDIVDSMQ